MKFIDFFYVCGSFFTSWIRIANPDQDPGTILNPDPDTDQDWIHNPAQNVVRWYISWIISWNFSLLKKFARKIYFFKTMSFVSVFKQENIYITNEVGSLVEQILII